MVVASRLKKYEDAKEEAQRSALLLERERNELTESVSFLKVRAGKLLVVQGFSGADMVALDVGRHSSNESMPARDAEVERL